MSTSTGSDSQTGTIERILNSKVVALIFAGFSGIFFTMSNFMVQVVIGSNPIKRIPTIEIVFMRCLVQLLFTLPILVLLRVQLIKERRDLIYTITMGLAGYLNVLVTYLSLDKIPISDTLLITFTSPFFCAVFSHCILKESLHWLDAVSGIFSFIGVIIVARPSFIFGKVGANSKQTLFQDPKLTADEHEKVYYSGAFYAVLGALCLALYFVLTRTCIRRNKLHPIVSVFYPSLIGTVLSPFLMLCRGQYFVTPYTMGGKFMLFSVGFYSCLALVFLIVALKNENATIVNLIRNLDVVYAFVLQYFIFHIIPNIWSIAGGTIIISATVSVVFRQWFVWKNQKKENEEEDLNECKYYKRLDNID